MTGQAERWRPEGCTPPGQPQPRRERALTAPDQAPTASTPATTSTPVTTGLLTNDDVTEAPDAGRGSFRQRWVNVIIARPVLAIIAAVSDGFRGLGDVQSAVPGEVTPSGDAALITVIPRGGPIDDSTKEASIMAVVFGGRKSSQRAGDAVRTT